MVCPKINSFAEQEPSAEVENACNTMYSITIITFIFHFLTKVLLCLSRQPCSVLRKKSQADARDPKQTSTWAHLFSPFQVPEQLSSLKMPWSLGQQLELGPSNFPSVIKNSVFIKGRQGNI